MARAARHLIGIDFGTLSAGAVAVRADDGEELGVGELQRIRDGAA